MSTTGTRPAAQRAGTMRDWGELPRLTPTDRLALRLGLALILWAQRHQERTTWLPRVGRTEQPHYRSADRAERSRSTALENRYHAGPTW